MKSRILAGWRRHKRGEQERRYVFIVTYGRSGSTVLQNVIGSIAGCHFNGENNDALAGLWASYRSACLSRTEQGDERRSGRGDPWRGAHLITPAEYNRKLIQVFIEEILRPPVDAWLVGFKEVRYFDYSDDLADYLDYIRMSFPPALLIFNRREGTAVANSAWWKAHHHDIAAEVRRFDGQTGAYAIQHPDDTIIVNYEDYCGDANALRPLFDRLGAPFDVDKVSQRLAERLDH